MTNPTQPRWYTKPKRSTTLIRHVSLYKIKMTTPTHPRWYNKDDEPHMAKKGHFHLDITKNLRHPHLSQSLYTCDQRRLIFHGLSLTVKFNYNFDKLHRCIVVRALKKWTIRPRHSRTWHPDLSNNVMKLYPVL